jgi:hypothetical protein
MKRSLFIFSIILCSTFTECQIFISLIPHGVVQNTVSEIKNIQPVSTDSFYEAFGFIDSSRQNTWTYYDRIGTTHLTGGSPYYREYNIAANKFLPPVKIASNTKDARDVYGTRMIDAGYTDSTMMFLQWSNNGVGGDQSVDLQIIKCDTNNHFGSPVNFDWTVIPVRLQRTYVFGRVVKGDNPGEYYEPLIQRNVDTGATRTRISILKTTDRWPHYTEIGVVYDGTTQFDEGCLANLGSGKFLILMRNDQAGTLTGYESTNSCVSWTARVASNLYWWISAGAEMACVYTHDGVFDILYECRDATCIEISKGNTVASNFGLIAPTYVTPEIYSRNLGIGGNPSLGYPAIRKLPDGKYLNVFAKQYNDNRANLQYTIDDLVTDPAGVPATPSTITTSFITSTSFRFDITNYTDKQVENIRYLQMDLSTDAGFSTFVTAKYRSTSAFAASTIQNIRLVGLWTTFNSLTTGTTYYLRIKACNNTDCSAYKIINMTTL